LQTLKLAKLRDHQMVLLPCLASKHRRHPRGRGRETGSTLPATDVGRRATSNRNAQMVKRRTRRVTRSARKSITRSAKKNRLRSPTWRRGRRLTSRSPEWIALHSDISQRIGRHRELCRVVLSGLWSLGPHHSFERQPMCLSKVCEAR